MSPYRYLVTAFAVIFIGIGLAILVDPTIKGGAAFGYIMGVLFIGLGLGRLYLLRARR